MPGPPPAAPPPELRDLYEQGAEYVWQSLRRLGVREADLEDVMHDVFVAVHHKLAAYDRTRPLKPWLFGFALRIAAAHRRSAAASREIPDGAPDTADPAPSPEDRAVGLDQHRLVMEALASLDLDQRAVFVLHEIDGYAMPEIAAALGDPVDTCYSRLRAARQRFTAAVHRIRLRRGEP